MGTCASIQALDADRQALKTMPFRIPRVRPSIPCPQTHNGAMTEGERSDCGGSGGVKTKEREEKGGRKKRLDVEKRDVRGGRSD